MAVLTPVDGNVSGFHAVHRSSISTCGGEKIALLIRTNAHDRLTIGRDSESLGINAFGRYRLWLASRNILGIEAHAVLRFVSGENEVLAVGEPARPLMVDGVVGQRL